MRRSRTTPLRRANAGRLRLAIAVGVLLLAVGIIAAGQGDTTPTIPPAGIARPAPDAGAFGYIPAREQAYVDRAIAGTDAVLFTRSPGGAVATAARVARWRALIDRTAAGTGIDPNLLEGIVFVESAGRPDAIAGGDPVAASGLTQILAGTATSLLGMHVDLARSRALTVRIDAARSRGAAAAAARLEARRAAVDDRFNPGRALAATVAYPRLAAARLGRPDLAAVSYHMGIGNLEQILADYDGGHPVAYAQLYFDTAPDRHPAAFRLLSGLGDDSSRYYWRVLGAMEIMRLYRHDRAALARLAALETADGAGAAVLHPPDRTTAFADPSALYRAYATRALVPLPSNSRRLGIVPNPSIGWLAHRVGAPPRLYVGLRPAALDLLVALAARVRALCGGSAARSRLIVASAVLDRRYESLLAESYPAAATGYSFQIERRYSGPAEAAALQAVLDRLTALDLVAWERTPATLDVTVAGDAARVLAGGP